MRTIERKPPGIDATAMAGSILAGDIGMRQAMRQCFAARGLSLGDSRHELIESLTQPRDAKAQLGRSDFANVLATTAGKSLVETAIGAPPQWSAWCAEASIDRLTGSVAYLQGPPVQSSNPQGAEANVTQSQDGGSSVTLSVYRGSTALSFEAIVNDDLNAFKSELDRLSASALATQDDAAVAAFLAGASGLTAATSAGAPSAARIDSMRSQLALLTNAKNQVMRSRAGVLLCPAALANQASAAAFEWNMTVAPAERLSVIAEPRLDSTSVLKWWVLPSPKVLPVAAVVFLAGNRDPVVTQVAKMESFEFFVRLPVGGAFLNTIAGIQNAGA